MKVVDPFMQPNGRGPGKRPDAARGRTFTVQVGSRGPDAEAAVRAIAELGKRQKIAGASAPPPSSRQSAADGGCPRASRTRRQRCSRSAASGFSHPLRVGHRPVRKDSGHPGSRTRAPDLLQREWFDRAIKLQCQVADSAYLAMAMSLRIPIATFDGGLASAARANKAKLYFPA